MTDIPLIPFHYYDESGNLIFRRTDIGQDDEDDEDQRDEPSRERED